MNLLKQPFSMGKISLNNRLVMPPMATGKSSEDGKVTEDLCAYYNEKSAGGHIGLIVTEHSYIDKAGKASPGQLSVAADYDSEGLAKLADIIHQNGSKVIVQINHSGSACKKEVTGSDPVGPSAIVRPGPGSKDMALPREMTADEIDALIANFAAAAVRVKEAGFDGVEIHSAHGYLLGQFFSPLTNRRTDAYGGSLENRIRLHVEVLKAVRAAVGKDFLLAIRLGACDYMEGGATLEDGVAACKAFEAAGADLLDISGNLCNFMKPGATEQGYFAELTEAIKREVSIPVILTGGIVDADAANRLLAEGKADLIGVGRAILKDSDWARRAMEE